MMKYDSMKAAPVASGQYGLPCNGEDERGRTERQDARDDGARPGLHPPLCRRDLPRYLVDPDWVGKRLI